MFGSSHALLSITAAHVVNMTVQFSSNETVSIEKQIDNSVKSVLTKPENINYEYEIDRCAEWIQNHNFTKVCLQFPDFLLPDSTEVALRLQSILEQTVYVMGDTAYESCCIDYVAAAHINADAVIHYGPVCFSKSSDNIPCLKIYEKNPLNLHRLQTAFHQEFCNCKESVVILADTPYVIHLGLIREAFKTHPKVTVHSVDDINIDLKELIAVFIGGNLRKIMNLKLSFKPKELYYFDANIESATMVNYEQDPKMLRRRYFLVEKIKDSNNIGIIIGTLAVRNYLRVIDRIKKLIQASGRKYYVISVGKPTVAKLANFPEIDIYVVITCSMNEIYDSRDFYKPIVAPFDVELALNPAADNVQFSYDYNSYLPDSDLSQEDLDNMEKQEGDVSLITGKLRANVKEEQKEEIKAGSALALRDGGTIALNTNFGAGFLSQRSWKGLQPNLGQDEPQLAEEGRRGIAQGYENEK